MELQEAEFHKSAAELKITARVNQYYILAIGYPIVPIYLFFVAISDRQAKRQTDRQIDRQIDTDELTHIQGQAERIRRNQFENSLK